MFHPRPPSRLRAAFLLPASLALLVGCFPTLEGAPCETDQNCPSSQFCNAGHCEAGQRPPRQATLSADAALGTATTASVGQTMTLTVTVQNTGTIILTGVTPAAPVSTGTTTATVISGPSPASVDRMIPGASTTFSWQVQPAAVGTLSFTVDVQGVASDNNQVVTDGSATGTVTVQRPALLEVTNLTGPSTVSRGQTFSVQMVVTNRGEARASQVAPAGAFPVNRTGGANALAGTLPASVSIDGGASATFQLTFTENGTAPGSMAISAGAQGQDANSGATLSATAATTGTVAVQAPASLTVTGFILPGAITRGGTFSAIMTVTNTGEAAASAVLPSPNPPTRSISGNANATTSTVLSPQSIPGGSSRTFTWNYTENGTGPGTLQLTAGALGTDANSGLQVSAATVQSNTAQVQGSAALQVTSFTIPTTLSRGQGFNAVMVVTNTGGSAANGVLPSPIPPTATATGGASATTSTTFSPVTIAAGASHTFTFNYTENGTGPGTLAFTARAAGTDSVSGSAVQSANATTPTATVQTPATLSITAFTLPSNISRGQTFTASLTISNTGQATALNVVPSPNPPGATTTGGANATTSSTPGAQTIAGGASATFTWTYTETGTGTGTFRLSAGATGTDVNTGGSISASTTNSNTAQVENPAALSVSSFTLPSAVIRGGTFTANMVVTNTGGASASLVIPNPTPPTVTATGGAGATSGTTLTAVTIPGGSNRTFSWTFTENGTSTGTLQLSAAVNGQDANSGAALNVPTVSSNVTSVQNPGGLVITDFSFPTSLSRGQTFTLSMTVQNSGGSTVNNVLPLPNPPTLVATGLANATTSSSPAPANITAGNSHTFTWSYTESGTSTGTVAFTGAASGTSSVNGSTITAGTVTTSTALVQTPANLTVTSLSMPTTLSRGQTFTVQMVVRNNGQATANNVLPSPIRPNISITGGANATSSTTPAAQNVAGGATATFTWTYTENGTGTGTVQFTGGATGTDANSGATVNAPSVSSSVATVQTPASLSIQSFTIPAVILRGSTFNASLTVRNNGQAKADLVIPSPNPPTETATGGANASTSTTVTSVSINGGATHTFTWSYTENGSGAGTLRYTTGATGTDANSGASLSATPASTGTANVQDPADLEITSFTVSQASVSVGQTFTASLTVRNRGGTTANGVLPSPNPPNLTSTGAAGATTSTSLTATNIAAGASQVFTWTYTATGGSGTVRFSAGATGTDAVSGATVTAPSTSTPVVTVQTPASLAITAFTIPAAISRGQAFSATMTVSNSGQAAANNVLPVPLRPTVVSTGGASASSSTSPAAQTIPGGGSVTFTWTYTESGIGPGTVRLNGNAQGTDANSGSVVAASSTDSNTTTVQQPPSLSVTSFTTSQSIIMRGGSFTLTMVVSNAGQAAAVNVLPVPNPPTLTPTGNANATTSTAQTPASIPGGGSATFTWTYTENGTNVGTLTFAAGAAGQDANNNNPVSAASSSSTTVTVQTPPNLVVTSISTTPATLTKGQNFTASLTVQNQGGTQANGVLPNPNPPTLSVTAGAPGATTSTTLTPANIPAGGTATFTWNYLENGAGVGTFTLTSGARGSNAVTGTQVNASPFTGPPVNVVAPAALLITVFSVPPNIASGASFPVNMTVNNTGDAAANNVLPSPLTLNPTGTASATLNTSPTAQSIPGGGQATFSWTYTNGTGTGSYFFSGNASGTDANSGAVVSAATSNSTIANTPIAPPLDVDVALLASPQTAEAGDTVTVTMEVSNRGREPAEIAPPASLLVDGPAQMEPVSGPSRAGATLAPGESGRFQWTYRALRRGWATFSGAAGDTLWVTSRHVAVPAPWCAEASSLLAFAGPDRGGRAYQPAVLGGAPAATGGARPYRYEWSPAAGLSSARVANPAAAPPAAQVEYALTVTDADGCQAGDAVRLGGAP